MKMKSCIVVLFVSFFASALFAEPDFADVSIRQRWPWSQKVDVSYTLLTDEAKYVSLTLYSGKTKLNIPQAALSGDIWNVPPGGPRTITFDPAKTAYTNQIMGNVHAVLTAGENPLYMIVDLTKAQNEVGQIVYLSWEAITNSEYGSWTVCPVQTNGVAVSDAPVWTGFTEDRAYESTKIVFRYVPAGTFTMGSPESEIGRATNYVGVETQHKVTLTKGMYVGVYPFTCVQYKTLMGKDPESKNGDDYAPLMSSWNSARGSSDTYNWPTVKTVDPASVIGVLRAKTGINTFDLPTDAQWEYACRAGTTGAWNNGTTSTNETVDAQLNFLGWYAGQQQWYTHRCGRLAPNGWGLYDMHGNTMEWSLDWYGPYTTDDAIDPVGPNSGLGAMRSLHGGCWYIPAGKCRSANRDPNTTGSISLGYGFRVFMTLE